MDLNSYELAIDSNGNILLPDFIGLNSESKLVIYQKNDCVVLLSYSELEEITLKIQNDKSLNLKERNCLKRSIFPFCSIIDFSLTSNNYIMIKLPKEVILKYNFFDKLVCKNINNKIYLYSYSKYDDINNGIKK